MGSLSSRNCTPCRGGVPPMNTSEAERFAKELDGWEVINNHHLHKLYQLSDFAASLRFVNEVSSLAEEQGHHPDICFGWGRAEITVWTHKADGLTESDFILAAKIDGLQHE